MVMRKVSVLLLVALGASIILCSEAKAVNPFNYTWYDIEVTPGSGVRYSGVSPSPIDPWFGRYYYSWELLEASGHWFLGWVPLIDYVPAVNKTGSNTIYDSPPVDMMNQHYFVERDIPLYGTVSAQADVHAWVDANGYGRVEVSNVAMDVFDAVRIDLALHIDASWLLGDASLNDNYVDDDDLSLLLANWNANTSEDGYEAKWRKGDFNYDKTVNDDDLSYLLAHWNWTDDGAPVGSCQPAITTTPEPMTLSLLGIGALALLRRRSR